MGEYPKASHAVYRLRYHFVFITKYIETPDAEPQDDDFRITE